MLLRAAILQPCCSLRRFLVISHRFSVSPNFSSISQPQVLSHFDEETEDFLPWLERKAGVAVSSKLYIGKSPHGRSLFASERIQTGDCILRVPYSAQIASNSLLPKLSVLLDNKIGSVAKLALVLLVEQKVCKEETEWGPYISCLPQLEEMHSTILEDYPQISRSITFQDFMHAYAIDFLNHDGFSKAVVLNDEEKQFSEVIADRDYAAHEEVLIRYGKFSNATLLLDFGFALPYNIHDQVKIQLNIPHDDLLREMKSEILQKYHLPTVEDDNGVDSSWNTFVIKEVKSASGKGKGLPPSLRAFARVLSSISYEDLSNLVNEAARTDGRLARQALKNGSREIQAHEFLLLRIDQIIQEYIACIKELGPANANSSFECKRYSLRKQMALYLLMGELRVLESASAWLKNYCAVDTDHGSWQLGDNTRA